jgi:peptide/nickel transport system substrate-binding protein
MFKFNRVILILLVILLVAMTVPTFTQEDNILIMARAVDNTGLDPHTQTSFASIRMLAMIYEPLVTTDHELNIAPALATSWEFSDDAMTLTMALREGVTFHDGSDFTADDVIASFERLLDEETASAARTNYLSIVSMDAPDDYTVVFNLSQSDVPLLSAMASTNAAILSADVIANGDPSADTNGTGPFMLEEWIPEETTTLAANTDWWGEGPFIDGIEIRIIPDETSILAALRAGTVDFAFIQDPLVGTLLMGDDDVTLARTPSISYMGIQMRAAREPLDILEVRQAISCALDRQEIVDSAALGEGRVTGPLTMASLALPLEELFCYEQDVERARELMASVGMEDGFTLPMMVANAEPPTATSIAQIVQAQLAEINIEVEIEALELGVYVDRWLAADFDAAVVNNGGRIDPYTMYSRYWQYDARFQEVAGYIDDSLDQLMKAGQAEGDFGARREIFAQLQRELTEKAPWIWLYTGFTYTAHQSSVTGWNPMANDSLYYLYEVELAD